MKQHRATIAAALVASLAVGCSSSSPTLVPSDAATQPPATGTAAAPSATPASSAASTPTAEPTAAPTSTVPATPVASPDADMIATWAAGICDINDDFLTGSQQIGTDLPDPPERTVESLKSHWGEVSSREHELYADIHQRLAQLSRIEGGDPFQDALVAEIEGQDANLSTFDQDIGAATTVEEIDGAVSALGTGASGFLADSARAVSAISLPLADAIAAITTGCRFLEYDARALLRGAVTKDFTATVIEDDLETAGTWPVGSFDGGEVAQEDGTLTITFLGSGTRDVSTRGQHPAKFHDVRAETTYSIDRLALSGLSCRGNGDTRYTVQVNPLGLVLIYRWGPEQTLLGRRTSPADAVAADEIHLAIECVDGNLSPLVIAVYLDGQRVAEVADPDPLASEGTVGMFAQGLGSSSITTYEDITVLVPAG